MHTDLQVSAARSVDRVPKVCGVADHGSVDFDPAPVVAQARLLLSLAEREALADLKAEKNVQSASDLTMFLWTLI